MEPPGAGPMEAADEGVGISIDHVGHLETIHVPDEDGWRKLLAYLGPGFMVAIAYLDPGNYETDLQAGAQFQYQLLWVLVWATLCGLLLQTLAANLGVVTGRHLAQHCRDEYPPRVSFGLWLVAELAIIASDIPEILGTAYALEMLLGLPLWIGVVLTVADTLLLLGLQAIDTRVLERLIAGLVFVMALCFLGEVYYAKPDLGQVAEGLLFPVIKDTNAAFLAISIFGAVVMPHNLYLHSALVLSRRTRRSARSLRAAMRYNAIECAIALFAALVINVAIVSVSGAVCHAPGLSPEAAEKCADLNLHNTPFLLANTLGRSARLLFAIALLASGQSSTVTGTCAGQYVMAGFLKLQVAPWLRNLITRSVAILPSLAVALLAGNSGAGMLIIVSSLILSFQLPYALLPLLKFSGSERKMGPFAARPLTTAATYAVAGVVMVTNICFLGSYMVDWRTQTDMAPAAANAVTAAAAVFAALYLGSLAYLTLRPDQCATYVPVVVSAVVGDDRLDRAAGNGQGPECTGAAAASTGSLHQPLLS